MAKPHDFIELSIQLDPEITEQAVALLSLEGISYFLEEEYCLKCYIPEEEWSTNLEQSVRARLEELTGTTSDCTVKHMADRNWNAEWEAHLKPVEISDRFIIVQKNKEYQLKPGQIAIEINPKMSFGTGYHATTRLMLRQLESMDVQPLKILDIGTGTGVLAIACRKLGCRNHILAVDNNDWAAENAKENIIDNNTPDIDVRMLDAEDDLQEILGDGFDLILANINKNVIGRILPAIRTRAPKSRIVISGIMIYDEPWLNKLLNTLDYTPMGAIYEDEWLSVIVDPNP